MDPLPPPSVSSSSDTYVCNFSDTNALSKDYSALLESEQTSDVSLLLACSQHEPMEDGGKAKGKKTKNNQIRLPAHKAILAARSPVFMAMLFGPMKESQLKEVVVGSEFAAETMMQLLRFIYTGTVDNVSMEQLVPLLACADHFQVESLDKQLLSYLERNVTPKNACTILSFAKYYKQEKVIELYTRFVHLHAPKVLKTESFLSLDFDILLILLQSSETRASEIDLWRGAVKWHDHQNPPPKPDKVEKLFSAIRYDQISGPQLVEDVRPKMHLVPKDLYVKALEKVAAPDSVSSYPSLGRRMPPIGSLRVNDPNLLEVTHGTRPGILPRRRYACGRTPETKFSNISPPRLRRRLMDEMSDQYSSSLIRRGLDDLVHEFEDVRPTFVENAIRSRIPATGGGSGSSPRSTSVQPSLSPRGGDAPDQSTITPPSFQPTRSKRPYARKEK